ncbi:hypothetical protein CDAR_269941 [Caerostris darwini]|uniref:Mediator complex subunit 11 n=1 Tax=Caerostris darwini TaxID=1538125 RepID=A0AAV4RPF6_9ARAC|nr:hypothetical protein CDAR_269941 [Caerostris darwini]
MSQSSSGPPAPDLTSPESPPFHEQGIIPADDHPSMMDVTLTVTREQLNDNNFLSNHSAPHKVLEPSIEHMLFFEELLKEAASLMLQIQKHQSAANNIRGPAWEQASKKVEEYSTRIRAICTYTGIPASHIPTKKEILEMRKQKDISDLAAAEAAKNIPAPVITPATPITQTAAPTTVPAASVTVPAAPVKPTSTTALKRKSPTSDEDEGLR